LAQVIAVGAKGTDFSHGIVPSMYKDRSLSYSVRVRIGNVFSS
jgi:hypothetical protein